ncbi:MAG: pyrroloquinoline quinone-dependent dehydrogenase [Halieaceae bacterium]
MLKLLSLASLLCAVAGTTQAQDWGHYGGGQHGRQYSGARQIQASNVGQLQEAWRFRTGELGQGSQDSFAFQANPILAQGKLYLTTGSAIVFALDPTTGEQIWRFDANIDRGVHHAEIANRGVSSWIDPTAAATATCHHRIFVGTLDARLLALDGATGKPCQNFGEAGQVYLDRDVRAAELEWINYTVTSPPVIIGDTLVVGSAIGDNRAVESELGIVRGLDTRTGAERWRWDPIPRSASDPAYAGWDSAQAAKNGSANAWAPLAGDPELGLVYVPTGSASPDFYGGERLGDNRYANSLVALRASDGSVAWHQQLVHHDVWDYDLPAQPTLVELRHEGKLLPAVLQATKMGLIFSFNRVTGEPIFAVEERPVPQGGVAGEQLSPTQPFPVAPPPVVRHAALTADDAWGMALFDEWLCGKRFAEMRSEGIYTPPSLEGTMQLPGYAGGTNWGGLAFDPASHTAVVRASDLPMEVALVPRDKLSAVHGSGEHGEQEFARQQGTPYAMRRGPILSVLGVPCTAPPWGTLTALDMQQGTIKWQVPLGTIEDLAPAAVPNFNFGTPGMGGPIITAGGLVFIAAAMDDYLRAFELATGKQLWQQRLPAGGQATPMTYIDPQSGRQFLVIAAGGHPRLGTRTGDYVIAYALPE